MSKVVLAFNKAANIVSFVLLAVVVSYVIVTYAIIKYSIPRNPSPSNCAEIMSTERGALNHVAKSIAVEMSGHSNARYTLYYAAIYYHLVIFWPHGSVRKMVKCNL